MSEISRRADEARKLAKYKELGISLSYRAVAEFAYGGSVITTPWESRAEAEIEARRLAGEYDGSAEYASQKVSWHGAELNEPPACVDYRGARQVVSRFPDDDYGH